MSIIFCDGKNAPMMGMRFIKSVEEEKQRDKELGPDTAYIRSNSADIRETIRSEMESGRTKWAQLTVEIDDIPLGFWLPSELETYCKVFSMKPFPTARSLQLDNTGFLELNSHWLSRLPKRAKSEKYRSRFLKYVQSRPKPLQNFYDFYGVPTDGLMQY